jgi:hypothetical protein
VEAGLGPVVCHPRGTRLVAPPVDGSSREFVHQFEPQQPESARGPETSRSSAPPPDRALTFKAPNVKPRWPRPLVDHAVASLRAWAVDPSLTIDAETNLPRCDAPTSTKSG